MKRFAIILPMGNGKTTLANKYEDRGFVDVDESRNDKLEVILKAERRAAMINGDWSRHNNIWFSHSRDYFKKRKFRTIFLHSKSHADFLGIPTENQFFGKIKLDLAKAAVYKRDGTDESVELAETNWNSVSGTIYNDHSTLEHAILDFVSSEEKKSAGTLDFSTIEANVDATLKRFGESPHEVISGVKDEVHGSGLYIRVDKNSQLDDCKVLVRVFSCSEYPIVRRGIP